MGNGHTWWAAACNLHISFSFILFSVYVVLGSVLLYGIAYFPLFAGLASRSLIGYGVASLFAWIFAIMNLYKTFECDLDAVKFCYLKLHLTN